MGKQKTINPKPSDYCCMLIDREGNAIQANMNAADISYFSPLLQDGATYRISNFLYYIGCLIRVGNIREFGSANTSQKTIRTLDIENLNGNVVELTLWDDMARNFNVADYNSMERPVIIAVSSCRVKIYGGALYKIQQDLNPPLEISKERFSNPEDEKSQNRFAVHGVRFTCKGTVLAINTTRDGHYASCSQCNHKVFDGDDIPQCVNHGPQPNYTFRYNFKAAISDGTGTGYFTFFTPNADILTRIDCPKLFHYSPHCEKGKVDFYFDTILVKPLQIASSSEQAENITDKEPSVIAIEMPKPVSAEICVSLPTSTCEPSSQLITASPTMTVESGNTPTQTEKKTLGSPKEIGTPAVELLEYPRTQASKKETSIEVPKKTSKRPLFLETQDDPKKKKMD
ncbi:nucleic acid-binding, OB-fold protein [Tanacetum coccineum]